MANTFHQNLLQSFANFKAKYIGNLPSGVTVTQINNDLGDKSSASAVSGDTAFAKINQLNNDLNGRVASLDDLVGVWNANGNVQTIGGFDGYNPFLKNEKYNNNQLEAQCGMYFDGTNFYGLGKKAGADAVVKKLGSQLLGTFNNPGTYYDGTGTYPNAWNIDVSTLVSNYTQLTADNFIFMPTATHTGAAVAATLYPDQDLNVSISYNAASGIVTINNWANIVGTSSWTVMGYIKTLKLYVI